MIEQMLNSGAYTPQPPDLPGIFLFDHQSRTDLVNNNATVSVSGAAVDSTYLIDGFPTTKLAATTHYMLITIPTPIELDANDWTVEWSCMVSAFQATRYDGEFAGSTTAAKALTSRWTDAGYGSALQTYVGAAASAAVLWRIAPAKQSVVGFLRRMAIVCRSGVITVFKDGQPQMVSNWDNVGNASKVVTQKTFPKEAGMGKLNLIRLGWASTVSPAAISNIGRIRISDYARYIHPYTPVPF